MELTYEVKKQFIKDYKKFYLKKKLRWRMILAYLYCYITTSQLCKSNNY